MNETEWFQGRGVEEHERAYWWRIVTEIFCAVVAGILLAGIPGCATTDPETKVCFMQMMGRTQNGLSVVAQTCMTQEQFAEAQK